jgi:hypothetical protein
VNRAALVLLNLLLLSSVSLAQQGTIDRDSASFTARSFRVTFGAAMIEGIYAGMQWRIPVDHQNEYSIGMEAAIGLGMDRWNVIPSMALVGQYVDAKAGLGTELCLRWSAEKWSNYGEKAYQRIVSFVPGIIARSSRNLFIFGVGPGIAFSEREIQSLNSVEIINNTEIVWDIALRFTF